jgi:ribosomal protein S18 acetylase RimI-like enzyme
VPASADNSVRIVHAVSTEHVDQARELLLEYAASLGFSLGFQGFDEELKNLPGAYAPPTGRLLLANHRDNAVGCVALRSLGKKTGEMKRLYVRPIGRGKGVGRLLVDGVIAEARLIGYERMRLDTIMSSMQDAIALYRSRGFREIPPYRENPIAGVLYLELVL